MLFDHVINNISVQVGALTSRRTIAFRLSGLLPSVILCFL